MTLSGVVVFYKATDKVGGSLLPAILPSTKGKDPGFHLKRGHGKFLQEPLSL